MATRVIFCAVSNLITFVVELNEIVINVFNTLGSPSLLCVLGSLQFQSLEIPLFGFELLDTFLERYDVFFASLLGLNRCYELL